MMSQWQSELMARFSATDFVFMFLILWCGWLCCMWWERERERAEYLQADSEAACPALQCPEGTMYK